MSRKTVKKLEDSLKSQDIHIEQSLQVANPSKFRQ